MSNKTFTTRKIMTTVRIYFGYILVMYSDEEICRDNSEKILVDSVNRVFLDRDEAYDALDDLAIEHISGLIQDGYPDDYIDYEVVIKEAKLESVTTISAS